MKVNTTIKSQARTASHLTIEVGRQGGLTVDKELHANSKNPVANAPVTVALNNINKKLQQAREDIDALTIVPGVGVDSAVQKTTEAAPNVADAEGAVALGSGNKNSSPQSVVEGVGNEITSGHSGNHVEGGGHSVSSTERSHIEGDCNVARSGKGMHVEGGNNEALDNYSHTEGYNNTNGSIGTHVEGMGNTADATSMGSHVEGTLNKAIKAAYAHIEGYNNTSSGAQSHIEGSNNNNSGFASHIEGGYNSATKELSHTEGRHNINNGIETHVEGVENEIDTNQSGTHVEGGGNKVVGTKRGHIEGDNNVVSAGKGLHVEGCENEASEDYSHTEGFHNINHATGSHVEGISNETKGSAMSSHVEGSQNIVSSSQSHTEGSENNNSGVMSHIEGSKNIGSGEACHIEGSENDGSGDFSHTEGLRNVNKSVGTHVEGMGNEVDNSSMGSHAEGTLNKITNASYAHVEGMDNKSSGPNSHTEGTDNENSAYAGHVEGKGNIGSGDSCHVEGHNNEVSATNGHAGGEGNVVSAHNAFAHGHGLKATVENEAVFGKFNYPRQNAIFSVGAGESDTARRTPFFVDKNGNTWIRDWSQANLSEDPNSVVELQDYLSTLEFKASDIYTIDTSKLTPWEGDIPELDENVQVLGELSDQQMADVEQALSSGKLLQICHASEGRIMTMTDCISGYTENENGDNVFVVTAYYWDPVVGGMIYILIANNLLMMMYESSRSIEYAKEEAIRIAQEYTDKKTENAVKPDESYPKMSVGFANNLVGRGEATAEEFTYRASAGMERSITDDTARVKKIKGNSVVWNNLLKSRPTDTKNGLICSVDGCKVTISGTVTKDVTIDEGAFWSAVEDDASTTGFFAKGHKFYVEGKSKHYNLRVYRDVSPAGNNLITEKTGETMRIAVYPNGSLASGTVLNESFYAKIIDLTKMFSAGNEPSTIDEFYARIPSGIDVNAYNEGEIINLNTEAIKTVGFNQWDEQWELGTLTDNGVIAHNSAIVSRNFNKIIPSTKYYCAYLSDVGSIGNILQIGFWDMNMVYIDRYYTTNKAIETPANAAYFKVATNTAANITTYNHDICINLSHTGTEDGKYKPYTPFTRELPIIKKYFPNGMRSAGTAFDSIEWDSSKQKWVAVQRVGERAYASGDESDATVLTNNTTTLYELAEPIVTEIEEDNINFDYYVEDFGTEEALSSVPSAPFRADVVYTFNAVDTIRNNYLAIEEMKKQMAQMQNAISAMQVAQVKGEE